MADEHHHLPTVAARPSNRDLANMDLPEAIDAYAPEYAAALPDNIPLQRFKRVLVTALNQNPDLAKCDRRSFFVASVKCAQDGLYPDGREAALVPLKGVVQYFQMIAGIRKRMRNSGEVLSAIAEVVYRNDHFRYVQGEEARIEHEPPSLTEERGEPVGAYAIIKLKNGETIREVMTKHEIERIRNLYSRASRDDAPWKTNPGEMWRKTVLRRASKSAPISSELEGMWQREDESQDYAPGPERPIPPRPIREQFETAATEHEDPPPVLYDVINCDGEVHPCTAATIDDNLRAVFAEAQRRGVKAFEAALDNNEATMLALRKAGEEHDPVLDEIKHMRETLAVRVRGPTQARPTAGDAPKEDATSTAQSPTRSDTGEGLAERLRGRLRLPEDQREELGTPILDERQNPADRPPAHSPADVPHNAAPRAQQDVSPTSPPGDAYVVPAIYENDGKTIAYRAWWLGRFLNKAREMKTAGEFATLKAANGTLIQGYYDTLAGAALIAAMRELDDIGAALK